MLYDYAQHAVDLDARAMIMSSMQYLYLPMEPEQLASDRKRGTGSDHRPIIIIAG